MNRNRTPAGIPTGGEFAANAHDEAAPMEDEDDSDVLFESTYDGSSFEVSEQGDGVYAVYRNGQYAGNFHTASDPEDHSAIEDAAIDQLLRRNFDYSDADPTMKESDRGHAVREYRATGEMISPRVARATAASIVGESNLYPELKTFAKFGRGSDTSLRRSLDDIVRLRRSGWRRGGNNSFEHDLDAMEDFLQKRIDL